MPRTSFVGMSPHIHFHWPDFGANLRGRNVAACRGRLAASPFVWCLFPVPPRDLRDCGQLTRVPCAGPRVFYKTRERALRKDCSIFWFGAHSFLSLLCSGISQTAIPGSFIQLLSRYPQHCWTVNLSFHAKLEGRIHRDGSLRCNQHQDPQATRHRGPQHKRYQR
jgi:hypothetical protein